jgi:hypothetical protein
VITSFLGAGSFPVFGRNRRGNSVRERTATWRGLPKADGSSLRQPGSERKAEAEPRKLEADGRSAKIPQSNVALLDMPDVI